MLVLCTPMGAAQPEPPREPLSTLQCDARAPLGVRIAKQYALGLDFVSSIHLTALQLDSAELQVGQSAGTR